MTPPSALSGPVPPLGIANFRHVTKCRGGSGGDLPSFLPVRCLMLKLVHPQISKPWECHLYFAQGCHLNFALTALQQGHRARVVARATIKYRRMVAIEFATCRSGRTGGASGWAILGNGRRRELIGGI